MYTTSAGPGARRPAPAALLLFLVGAAAACCALAGFTPAYAQPTAAPYPPADYLLVSNSPETVPRPGILLEHRLEGGTRYRLFFHHLNGTGAPAALQVTLQGAEAAGEAVDGRPVEAEATIAGIAVSPSPVTSGWQAAAAYAGAGGAPNAGGAGPEGAAGPGAGVVRAALDPQGERAVWEGPVPAGHVATGYLLVEVDGPAVLRVRLGQGDALLPPDGVHARGLLANPQVEEAISFSLAQKVLEIPFGSSRRFQDLLTGQVLRGDYGIDHSYHLEVHNPYDVPMPLHLLFIPRGGDGRVVLRIDGQVYTSPRTFSGHYFHLRRWVIYPGQTRKISVWTTPVSAMGYPAVLRFSTYVDSGWPRHPTSPQG